MKNTTKLLAISIGSIAAFSAGFASGQSIHTPDRAPAWGMLLTSSIPIDLDLKSAVLDESVWSVELPSTYGPSSITYNQNASLTLTNGPWLTLVDQLPVVSSISGLFVLNDEWDMFNVTIRTSGLGGPVRPQNPKDGLIVVFGGRDNSAGIGVHSNKDWKLLGNSDFPALPVGVPISFSIVDSGTSITVSMNSLPAIVVQYDAEEFPDSGVVIHNREGWWFDHNLDLLSLKITGDDPQDHPGRGNPVRARK